MSKYFNPDERNAAKEAKLRYEETVNAWGEALTVAAMAVFFNGIPMYACFFME